jgi:hypothetical protein
MQGGRSQETDWRAGSRFAASHSAGDRILAARGFRRCIRLQCARTASQSLFLKNQNPILPAKGGVGLFVARKGVIA